MKEDSTKKNQQKILKNKTKKNNYKLRKVNKKDCYKVINTKTKRVFSKCTTKTKAKKQLNLLRAYRYNKNFVSNKFIYKS